MIRPHIVRKIELPGLFLDHYIQMLCGREAVAIHGPVRISGKTATERAYLGEFLTAVANARARCITRQMSLR
jgi:hypothetical protein